MKIGLLSTGYIRLPNGLLATKRMVNLQDEEAAHSTKRNQ